MYGPKGAFDNIRHTLILFKSSLQTTNFFFLVKYVCFSDESTSNLSDEEKKLARPFGANYLQAMFDNQYLNHQKCCIIIILGTKYFFYLMSSIKMSNVSEIIKISIIKFFTLFNLLIF